MERTLVLLKPDAYARGMLGALTTTFEQKGLILVACKLTVLSDELLDEHYQHLSHQPFFPRILRFMKSLPVLAQCWEGRDAVAVVRALAGPTDGRDAAAGTLRGDRSLSVQCNLIHASDTAETADKEVRRFFNDFEIFDVQHPLTPWLYAEGEVIEA